MPHEDHPDSLIGLSEQSRDQENNYDTGLCHCLKAQAAFFRCVVHFQKMRTTEELLGPSRTSLID